MTMTKRMILVSALLGVMTPGLSSGAAIRYMNSGDYLVSSNWQGGVIPGAGDQARINLGDGAIWIRVDNLTFTVGAYSGAPQPRFVPKIDPKAMDLKAIAAAAQAAQREWVAKTIEQRKRDAETLARAVLARL